MNRVRMATDAAIAHGRKIAVFGRSMESAVTNGRALGYLNIPDNMLVEQSEIKHIPDDELLILSSWTSHQGEPMAALARIAEGTHKQIRLKPKDNVILRRLSQYQEIPLRSMLSSISLKKAVPMLYMVKSITFILLVMAVKKNRN